jgi:hypothetical protein
MSLSMNNDSKSLETIWSELSNPNKEIRAGALEAVVQFGDRSTVLRLRELASETADPTEKASILAAADFLNLPSIADLPARQPSAESAASPANPGSKSGDSRHAHPAQPPKSN